MQISLLAVIPILCFTRCQSQETAENSEIIDKFRDLLYDETTLSPYYEESTDPDMGVTRPSTTPSPSSPSSPSSVTTTLASSKEENLSEADLEVNSNDVQSMLEPRQLVLSQDQDYQAVLESDANSVTFPEVETIQVISNPLPDLSVDVPDTFGALPDKTAEDTADNMNKVSPELDNIISDSGQAGESPAKWFYYSGHPGLMPHYFWPNTMAEETNEIEDRVRIKPQAIGYPYPYHYPYFHRGHHPYVYFYRSASHV